MAAKENASAHSPTQKFHRSLHALLVDFRCAERRAVGTLLAKRKVAAQHRNSILGEVFCKSYEQRRIAIPSGSMGKNKTIAAGSRTMKKATDARTSSGLLMD